MLRIIFLFFLTKNVFAIVPTIDENVVTKDLTTMNDYIATVGGYVTGISQAITAAQQITQLKSLQQIQSMADQLCSRCATTDVKQLQDYINNVNDDLCTQFSWAIQNVTGVVQDVTTIAEIIVAIETNPQAAELALQQAAIQIQVSTQNTLAQMQMLMAQQGQKALAERKLEQQNNINAYTGFMKSGL